jgi:hypothetical protein
MKRIFSLLLIFSSFSAHAQVGMNFNLGISKTFIAKVDSQYNYKNSQVIVNYMGFASNKAALPTVIVNAAYGYNISSWQPYVGYGTQGLTYGVNKYFNSLVIGGGKMGDYGYFTIGTTSLKFPDKSKLLTGNDWAIIAAQVLSGYANGMHEAIQAGHWGTGQFWDNSISCKNKYKDFDAGDLRPKFIGSKTALVGFTDGYHLTNLVSNAANLATISFCVTTHEPINFKMVAKKMLLAALANRAAFYLSYNIIYK